MDDAQDLLPHVICKGYGRLLGVEVLLSPKGQDMQARGTADSSAQPQSAPTMPLHIKMPLPNDNSQDR
jgi:hypothetical protein